MNKKLTNTDPLPTKKIGKKSSSSSAAPSKPSKPNKEPKSLPPKVPSRNERLEHNITKTFLEFVNGKNYKAATKEELIEKLHIPEIHRSLFEEILEKSIDNGILALDHQKRYISADKAQKVIQGTLSMNPRGFGFVTAYPNSGYNVDIFIPKPFTNNGTHGDVVEVLITSETGLNDKGPEGKILSIIKRSRSHIAGTILSVNTESPQYATAYAPILGPNKRIEVTAASEFMPIKEGDRVIMHVTNWGGENQKTTCEVLHHLGHISDPSCDIPAAIEEFGFSKEFPAAVLKEVAKFADRVTSNDMRGRVDLREVECFTIDPKTAKDFDDALSLSKDKKGRYRLGVHIADVSHYVKVGSALDKEALARCNSTYFPGFCLPMLPHELSNNLCSLKEKVNRLCISVLVDIDAEGNVIKYEIVRSVIHSAKRFTYEEAKEVLDGNKKSKHKPTLELMVELCHLLKKQRASRGSIEFALPDIVLKVDEEGTPTGIERVEYDITHQLVEEFMLKANEIVATHLSKLGQVIPYRIHEEPSVDSMEEFSSLAAIFGIKLQSPPTTEELQSLFKEASEYHYGQQLSVAFIKSMRLATYSTSNAGHYGLSLEYYTHFTSPIRRYIDLVIHRCLFEPTFYNEEMLQAICNSCSEKERQSMRAETSVITLKKLRLIDAHIKANPNMEYRAIVTKVKAFGVSFEILDFMLEGFVHISQVGDDYFIYDEAQSILRGRRHGLTYHIGDAITIKPKSINLITLDSRWELISNATAAARPKPVIAQRERPNKVARVLHHWKEMLSKATLFTLEKLSGDRKRSRKLNLKEKAITIENYKALEKFEEAPAPIAKSKNSKIVTKSSSNNKLVEPEKRPVVKEVAAKVPPKTKAKKEKEPELMVEIVSVPAKGKKKVAATAVEPPKSEPKASIKTAKKEVNTSKQKKVEEAIPPKKATPKTKKQIEVLEEKPVQPKTKVTKVVKQKEPKIKEPEPKKATAAPKKTTKAKAAEVEVKPTKPTKVQTTKTTAKKGTKK
ncbi:MAG: Ribonuclease [Chlamydiales bacterium]|jgi:ribonuclease R|nr:Ribonuclease [Chlamydiales bacterium]